MESMTNPAIDVVGTGIRLAPATAAHRPFPVGAASTAPRAPYAPPTFERLGPWQALTLQQSVPIFP